MSEFGGRLMWAFRGWHEPNLARHTIEKEKDQ
jgi:hypothetical protein